MAKLLINTNNKLVITQSDGEPHGADQGYKAFDFQPFDLILNTDCHVTLISGRGRLQYFNVKLSDGSIIQCVHGKPTRGLGFYKAGELVGRVVPYTDSKGRRADHWHLAILVKGVWYRILDYIDRNVVLGLSGDFQSQHWKNWSTYNDFQLNIATTNMFDINTIINTFGKKWNNLLKPWDRDDGNDFGFLRALWYQGKYSDVTDQFAIRIDFLQKQTETLTLENLALKKQLEETKKVTDVRIIENLVTQTQTSKSFVPRTESVKAFLGMVKNTILPSLGTILVGFGVNTEQSTSIVGGLIALIGAILLEVDKTNYNKQEKENVKTN